MKTDPRYWTCLTCIHWDQEGAKHMHHDHPADCGLCRKHSPVITPNSQFRNWPITTQTDRCGDYQSSVGEGPDFTYSCSVCGESWNGYKPLCPFCWPEAQKPQK